MTVSELNKTFHQKKELLEQSKISLWYESKIISKIENHKVIPNPEIKGVEIESDKLYLIYYKSSRQGMTYLDWVVELNDISLVFKKDEEENYKKFDPLLEKLQERYLVDPDYSLKQLIYDILLWTGRITD